MLVFIMLMFDIKAVLIDFFVHLWAGQNLKDNFPTSYICTVPN